MMMMIRFWKLYSRRNLISVLNSYQNDEEWWFNYTYDPSQTEKNNNFILLDDDSSSNKKIEIQIGIERIVRDIDDEISSFF